MRRLALVLVFLSVSYGCASRTATAPQPAAAPRAVTTPPQLVAQETYYNTYPRFSPRAQCFQRRDGSAWRPTAKECESMSP
jgi:hypothetical protein